MQDLHLGGVEHVDGQGEGELDGLEAGAVAVHAAGEVAEGEGQVVGAGLRGEAEGLALAVGAFCPDFVELKGLVAQQGEADGGTGSNLAGREVRAAAAYGGLCGLGKEGHRTGVSGCA